MNESGKSSRKEHEEAEILDETNESEGEQEPTGEALALADLEDAEAVNSDDEDGQLRLVWQLSVNIFLS